MADKGKGREQGGSDVIATNRKAFFNYHILEKAEAGLALVGSEVKAIREGGLNFKDAYVDFRHGELFLVGAHVAAYSHGGYSNHAPERVRKLLLHKREILRLGGKATEKGLTLVPLSAYYKNGKIKVEIGLARGKQAHDKRDAIRDRDIDRDARREMSERKRG